MVSRVAIRSFNYTVARPDALRDEKCPPLYIKHCKTRFFTKKNSKVNRVECSRQ